LIVLVCDPVPKEIAYPAANAVTHDPTITITAQGSMRRVLSSLPITAHS
jgi:hypothetical protein